MPVRSGHFITTWGTLQILHCQVYDSCWLWGIAHVFVVQQTKLFQLDVSFLQLLSQKWASLSVWLPCVQSYPGQTWCSSSVPFTHSASSRVPQYCWSCPVRQISQEMLVSQAFCLVQTLMRHGIHFQTCWTKFCTSWIQAGRLQMHERLVKDSLTQHDLQAYRYP